MPAAELPANVAPFQFTAGGAAFAVEAFAGREALSEPFHFDIELLSEDPNVDAAALLGASATLVRHRGDQPVEVHGIIAAFAAGDQTPDRSRYRATLVPRLWRLGLARQSRVFQDATVPEVVLSVLEEHGLDGAAVRADLTESYPRSEFIVQYQESDLAFVRRLLEREGAWFAFDFSSGSDVLVLSDTHGRFPSLDAGPGGHDDVAFREGSGMVRDRGEAIDRLSAQDQLVPGRVVLKDYNYRTPETDLEVGAAVDGGGTEEVYAFGDHYKTSAEGSRLARIRAQELTSRRRVLSGASDVGGFAAGLTFSLSGHPRADLDGDFLLTAVEHRATRPDASGDGAPAALRYDNTFTAIPAAAPFRPARTTPVPTAPGLMTARTESAGGPYAFVDAEGRYRARLALDRSGAAEAQASRPLRLAQPYSGPDYGLHLPNHAGTEMLLGFTNGDLDRPIALGTVPNPSQGSPAVAPNRMENVLRSWAGNALVLDDTRGGEHVHLTAVKDHTETVADAQVVDVGSSQDISVGTDRTKRVEQDQSESVGGDKTITVDGTHTEQIGGDTSVRIGGEETVTVDKSSTVRIGEARSLSVETDQATSIGESMTLSVGDKATVSVSDSATVRVSKDVDVRGGTTIHVEAADKLSLVCGKSKIVMQSDGTITVEGAAISVKGSSRIALKAPKIKEN